MDSAVAGTSEGRERHPQGLGAPHELHHYCDTGTMPRMDIGFLAATACIRGPCQCRSLRFLSLGLRAPYGSYMH